MPFDPTMKCGDCAYFMAIAGTDSGECHESPPCASDCGSAAVYPVVFIHTTSCREFEKS